MYKYRNDGKIYNMTQTFDNMLRFICKPTVCLSTVGAVDSMRRNKMLLLPSRSTGTNASRVF